MFRKEEGAWDIWKKPRPANQARGLDWVCDRPSKKSNRLATGRFGRSVTSSASSRRHAAQCGDENCSSATPVTLPLSPEKRPFAASAPQQLLCTVHLNDEALQRPPADAFSRVEEVPPEAVQASGDCPVMELQQNNRLCSHNKVTQEHRFLDQQFSFMPATEWWTVAVAVAVRNVQ